MKDVQKVNNMATNPIKDILIGSVVKVIEERKVGLMMSEILPRVTDTDGIDVTTKEVVFNREYFKGKAIVTDQRPESVPTVIMDSERVKVPMKWISTGLRVTDVDRDLYAAGKTKFENKAKAGMRTIEEEEDSFLKNGVTELGVDGVKTVTGINVVPATDLWANLTGPEILEEIRVAWNAHTIDNLFEARNFWLDKDLFDMLQKPYSVDEPKTILTVLRERNWFETITSIPRFETAMIVEDNNDCFGYIEDLPLGIHREYREATTDIYMLEEHISGLMIFQPKSLTKLEGCK